MKITFNMIVELSKVKKLSDLAKSKVKCLEVVKVNFDKQFSYRSKLKTRQVNDKEVRYTSQDAVQARVQDDYFIIENIKTTSVSLERLHDKIEIHKSEVKKLLDYLKNKNFQEFKSLLKNLSLFVLFTHSNSIMNKHERFYSQCLEQFDYLTDRFFTECEHSRSKKIEVKQKTLDRRHAEHENIIKLLSIKSKSKAKTSKAVKSKKSKVKVKVS